MQDDSITGTKNNHRTTHASTTLNRKYVKKPMATKAEPNAELKRRQELADKINRENNMRLAAARRGYIESNKATKIMAAKPVDNTPIAPASRHPLQAAIAKKSSTKTAPIKEYTAKELKDRAIAQALKSAQKVQEPKRIKNPTNFARIFFAFSCAVVSVLAIGYLIKINLPDISLRVAAIQTGIEANYPSYVPSDYHLAEITSSEQTITIKFAKNNSADYFNLTEQSSSWDSTALLNNYVYSHLASDFTTLHEQGLTIYTDGKTSTWVNGGFFYTISSESEILTKKQIKMLAVSL